ncbi:MAG TPA: EpsI family protein, partial [Solibacterales bacterium]|nr:EpsI family protein [Bryobacterales bacterium]
HAHREVIPDTPPWSQFPQQVGEWQSVAEIPIDDVVLEQLRPDDFLSRTYALRGAQPSVNVFVGYFNTQRTGRAPHSPKNCLPGSGWEAVWAETARIPVEGQKDLEVTKFLVQKNRTKLVVIYWYQSADWAIGNEYVAQLLAVPQLLSHGRTDVALVRIIAPMAESTEAKAFDVAASFAKLLYPMVKGHIPST